MYAFRCKACGHFEPAGAAGECHCPHACSVCGAGVSFNPKTGSKIFDHDNWEILADCDQLRLAELGLDGQVERHCPCEPSGNVPKNVHVQTGNYLGLRQSTQ